MDELKAVLVGVVSMLVVQGFKLLGDWIKHDLSKAGAFVAFVVVAGFIGAYDALAAKIPFEYRSLAGQLAQWLVVLFSGSGLFRVYLKVRK